MKRSFFLIAPYAAWMALMSAANSGLLPKSAFTYAMQGLVAAALLLTALFSCGWRCLAGNGGTEGPNAGGVVKSALSATLVGLVVLFVWIAPEGWLWPSTSTADITSPYHPSTCGWTLTVAKLCASAFVISAAEELFFRKWLVEFAGFGWMLVLFGLEHMRFDLGYVRGSVFIAEGVFAGLCYGLLAKRFGILSAIIAHAVTNLLLGLYVVMFDKWFYW